MRERADERVTHKSDERVRESDSQRFVRERADESILRDEMAYEFRG